MNSHRHDPPFDGVTDLGRLSRVLRASTAPVVVYGLVFLFAGLAAYLLSAVAHYSPYLPLLVVEGIAGLLWFLAWRASWRALAVFEKGLAYFDGRSVMRLRWQDIRHAEARETRDWEGGRSRSYILHTVDGRTVHLPGELSRVHELWHTVTQHAPAWDGDQRRQPE